jgi:hypothetical protein
VSATVVQSGSYLLELDTGFDSTSFRLDSSSRGILDTNLLGPSANDFADITEFTTLVAYNRGRRKTDYQFGAGTLTFVMRDETGILGPYDTSSPYYDPGNSQPGLAPMRKIRLSRNSEYLFQGHVTSYEYNFAMAGPNTVSVQCSDDFYLLAQTQLDTFNVDAELSGTRVTKILDRTEVAYPAGTRSIAAGTVELGGVGAYTIDAGTNTLAYLNKINEAEQGRLFMSRDGVFTFEERIGQTLSNPVVNFRDDGTGLNYQDLVVEFDADNVVNRAYVEPLSGSTATANDAPSQAKYFIQSVSITDSLLHVAGEITALANYLLEPEPEPRYTSVTTWFGSLTSGQRDDVATVDIGDTITIEKVIPGLGSQVAAELAVEGIAAIIDFNNGHRVTFYTSPTLVVYNLLLDDVQFGIIDSNNVLG